QPQHRRGKFVLIAGSDQQSRVVAYHVRNATDRRSDHRLPAGHGLDHAIRRAFSKRWHDKNIQALHERPAFFRMRINPVIAVMTGNVERLYPRGDLVTLRSIAGEVNDDIRVLRAGDSERLYQSHGALEGLDTRREAKGEFSCGMRGVPVAVGKALGHDRQYRKRLA